MTDAHLSALSTAESQPPPRPQTDWHRLLGAVLEALLTPVGVTVQTEVPITNESPRADILLLRREGSHWTAEQRTRLPDGVRESAASHILLEFKYSETVNVAALVQAVAYDYFYRQTQHLGEANVLTLVVSAKTPRKARLRQFGYRSTQTPGVYHSAQPLLQRIPLLVLNDLQDEPYNAFIKCFASQGAEKAAAFSLLEQLEVRQLSIELDELLEGLWGLWYGPKGAEMKEMEITPEMVRAMGKRWRRFFLAGLTLQERLAGLAPEERLAGLAPEERLAGLDIAAIEAYLRQRKQAEAARQPTENLPAPASKQATSRRKSTKRSK